MRLILDDSANVCAWVSERIPQMGGGYFDQYAIGIGVASNDGGALGGVVFHDYQPRARNIEVSFASDGPRWLSRAMISGILAFPFDQLQLNRITTLTPRLNVPARRFVELFGFKREGVIRQGFGDDDMIVSGMLRSEWSRSRFNLHRDPAVPIVRPVTSFRRKMSVAHTPLAPALH